MVSVSRIGAQEKKRKALDVGVVHAPIHLLVGRNWRQVAPIVGQVVDQPFETVNMEQPPLRLIAYDVAVDLDLPRLGHKRLAFLGELAVGVERLFIEFLDIDKTVFLELLPLRSL